MKQNCLFSLFCFSLMNSLTLSLNHFVSLWYLKEGICNRNINSLYLYCICVVSINHFFEILERIKVFYHTIPNRYRPSTNYILLGRVTDMCGFYLDPFMTSRKNRFRIQPPRNSRIRIRLFNKKPDSDL